MVHIKMYSIRWHYLLIISTVLILNHCAPLQEDSEATILNYHFENDGKGNYNFRYDTSNGITREETGTLVDVGLPNEHISVQGSYSYIDPEGKLVTLKYIADENGYTILTPPNVPPSSPFTTSISQAVLSSLLGK